MVGTVSARESSPELRQQVRAAISNAYYEARNDRQTMEYAADQATIAVLRIIESVDRNAHARGAAEVRDTFRHEVDPSMDGIWRAAVEDLDKIVDEIVTREVRS